MGWCFNPMKTPDLAAHCKAIGLRGMEGKIGRAHV